MSWTPIFSVVIPTYEPGQFLREALRSVLAQDPGQDQMQIAIVDDASPKADIAALLAGIADPQRVEVHRHSVNLGLAGNWNRAVATARGGLIHILHQDDLVRCGFYSQLLRGFRQVPDIGMAFCRHAYIDEFDVVTRISHRERWRAGVLHRWLNCIGESQRIQCPSAIVSHKVYEAIGGFREDLRYTLDWEMWVRIAANYPVWYEPATLACYRRHSGNETARLRSSSALGADTLKAIEMLAMHFPSESRSAMKLKAYQTVVQTELRRAKKSIDNGLLAHAPQQLVTARSAIDRLPPSFALRSYRRRLQRLENRLPQSTDT